MPGKRRQAILAMLAIQLGEVVSADQLIEVVWEGRPPSTAKNTLQSTVSYLRRTLSTPQILNARSNGYVLELGPGGTDLAQAEEMLGAHRSAESPEQAASMLHSALGLWQGRPLPGLVGIDWFDQAVHRIDLLHRSITHRLTDLRLQMGEHVALLQGLEALAAQNPFDEAIHHQLMMALYRSGRQVEALEVYHRLRARLDDELGVRPCADLQELESRILRQDASLMMGALTPSHGRRHIPPAQLPPLLRHFTGRVDELSWLAETVLDGGPQAAPASDVVVLTGCGGIGKTSVAVRWAHEVADTFPDGQLFADLRGYAASRPADSADVAYGFLTAMGYAPESIPADATARLGLYRTALAGRSLLVLLDNVRTADQVQPLIPTAPGCVTVITSRSRLTALAVTHAPRILEVGPMSSADARTMIRKRVGGQRLEEDSAAAEALADRGAGLPLALAILAARVSMDDSRPIADYLHHLDTALSPLDALTGGDDTTDLRSVFSWSYNGLTPEAARVFRFVSLVPGGPFTLSAAASISGSTKPAVLASLEELIEASLLTTTGGGRFALHDLLALYAAEKLRLTEGHMVPAAAVERLLNHYLRSAWSAAKIYTPLRPPIECIAPPASDAGAPTTVGEAIDWFRTERTFLVAAVSTAAEAGLHVHTWQLAWSLTTFLDWHGHWQDLAGVHRLALEAAHRLNDKVAETHALRGLAFASRSLGCYDEAAGFFTSALESCQDLGDLSGEARLHLNFANVLGRQGAHNLARQHSQLALRLYRQVGDRNGLASALNAVGWHSAMLGDHNGGLRRCRQALEILLASDQRDGRGPTYDSIGYIHHQRGQYNEAIAAYVEATHLHQEFGDRFHEAETLDRLGDAYHQVGRQNLAVACWRYSASILSDLNSPEAKRVHDKAAAQS